MGETAPEHWFWFWFWFQVIPGPDQGSSRTWREPLVPSHRLLSRPPASEGRSTSPGILPEGLAGPSRSTTRDAVRSPVATTAPPPDLLNHHPIYPRPPDPQGPLSPHHPDYPGDSGGHRSWSSSWSSSKPTSGGKPSPAAPTTSLVLADANREEEEMTTSIITTTTVTTTQSPGESPANH